MKYLLALLLLLPLCLTSCKTGGDPKIALPQLTELTEDEFAVLCADAQFLSEAAFSVAIREKVLSTDTAIEVINALDIALAIDTICTGPHPLTAFLREHNYRDPEVLSALYVIEVAFSRQLDFGELNSPLQPRLRVLLQSIVNGLKSATLTHQA